VGFGVKILRKDTYGTTHTKYGLVRFCKTSRREEGSGKKLKRKDYAKKEETCDFLCIDRYDWS
jgi:hypothetical protein